jgi:predicted DCC family thiol-disulfide oxidoreductase YuxK
MSTPVLLYDGACGLCACSVRFVLRHERRHDLHFARLDGAFARPILERHPALRALDTVAWYESADQARPERLQTRSAAVLEVLRYLGGRWRLGLVAAIVPRPCLDLLYRLVARHRRHVFGAGRSCILPTVADRHRFLD